MGCNTSQESSTAAATAAVAESTNTQTETETESMNNLTKDVNQVNTEVVDGDGAADIAKKIESSTTVFDNNNQQQKNTITEKIVDIKRIIIKEEEDDDADNNNNNNNDAADKNENDKTNTNRNLNGVSSIQIQNDIFPEKDEEEEEAAKKIQAIYRGHKVRSNLKQQVGGGDTNNTITSTAAIINDNTIMATNKNTNNNNTTTSATIQNAKTPEGIATKEELEAEFREDDKELCDAATRIQATFRGHLARKLANDSNAVANESDIQEITKQVAEELDIDLSDPELNKAATKIQASFRGHKARRNENDPAAN